MLIEGADYLFYRSAFHAAGAVNEEVAVVATRRYMFLVPVREPMLRRAWFVEGLSISEALAKFLAWPHLTVHALETELLSLLPPGRCVVRLDVLARMTVWSKFLRQVRFKQRTRDATQVLALRGKANHDRFKAFYAIT